MTEAKALALVVTANVSEEALRAMKSMFRSTWQYIGADCLELNNGRAMKGSEVQEMVADADRYKMDGRNKAAAAIFDALPRDVQDAVLELTFPSTRRYGM